MPVSRKDKDEEGMYKNLLFLVIITCNVFKLFLWKTNHLKTLETTIFNYLTLLYFLTFA